MPEPAWTDCLRCSRPNGYSPPVIGILPGEGVGPEITDHCLDILKAVASETGFHYQCVFGSEIGRAAERMGYPALTHEIIAFCGQVFASGGAILNGPGGGRYVYDLRRQFDLFFKISPLQAVNGTPDASVFRSSHVRTIDILLTRENAQGVYQGKWTRGECPSRGEHAEHTFSYDQSHVCRFLEASARLAETRKGRLTVVWKESGIPSISELWRDCALQVKNRHGVSVEMVDIDLMSYRLVQTPHAFDVIATPNLFGDILGDLGAALIGSRGLSYSGNFGAHGEAVYQTNHGAAYDLAGKDACNPAGQILSMAMMLRESYGKTLESLAILDGLRSVWRAGFRTADVSSREGDCQIVGTAVFATHVREAASAAAKKRISLGSGDKHPLAVG